ncbi:MAG TPA: archaellin/type IV pilin N-terminal domain-containing protein [Candidatus Thermoplasmatota archaeon]|nr:archaellin/type IV pilin N-terminal domain-containing protein [Candidatus Thermoplasmatota archaeon]
MKANRLSKHSNMNDRGEVGVGTLIVFIAMVLVAAVAAAVLINTSGVLQQRASQTGKAATQEVSSNLKVVGIYGIRNGTASTDDLYQLKFNVELSAGAPPLDVQKVVMRYSDGVRVREYDYSGTPIWTATWLRDVTGTGATNKVMSAGDLVEFAIDVPVEIAERKTVQVLFIPESGASIPADFTTPPTYGTETTVSLR